MTTLNKHYAKEQLLTLPTLDLIQAGEDLADVVVFEIASSAKPNPHQLHRALLRATMMSNRILVREASPGKNLGTLIEHLASQLDTIPGLTYEGLIYHNFAGPSEPPETFLIGEAAQSEIFFYEIHGKIEALLAKIIPQIYQLLTYLNEGRSTTERVDLNSRFVQIILHELIQQFTNIRNFLIELFRGLPDEHFAQMRPFFTNPSQPLKIHGPSGKYSAGMFVVDALLCGSHPIMRSFLQRKMAERKYFPTTSIQTHGFTGQVDIEQSMGIVEHGLDLRNRAIQLNEPLFRNTVEQILEILSKIRDTHIGLIYKFLVGVEKGSADENIKDHIERVRSLFAQIVPLPPLKLF